MSARALVAIAAVRDRLRAWKKRAADLSTRRKEAIGRLARERDDIWSKLGEETGRANALELERDAARRDVDNEIAKRVGYAG